jgi:hypothetical protein
MMACKLACSYLHHGLLAEKQIQVDIDLASSKNLPEMFEKRGILNRFVLPHHMGHENIILHI